MKKFLIILLSLSLIACGDEGSNDSPANNNNLPPLTYTYKFDNCPFEVKFPEKPEVDNELSYYTEAKVIIVPNVYRATCIDTTQLNIQGLTVLEFSEQHLSESLNSLNSEFYSNATYTRSVPNKLENAYHSSSVYLTEFGNVYKLVGVHFILGDYILSMGYTSRNLENTEEEALKFYKTVIFNPIP